MTKHAVRGGSVWRHKKGVKVRVVACRTVNPMQSVRPHSDMRWKLVTFKYLEGPLAGVGVDVLHENDFRKRYSWVSGK